MKRSPCIPLLTVVAAFLVSVEMRLEAHETKKLVLLAGLKSHGPEGNGIHDYPWSVRLLKTMLETSNIREQVAVSVHLNGWPHDTKSLQDADTIMIISDGRDGDVGREAPHLATTQRVQLVDTLMHNGCGIVVFHFSTFAPDDLAQHVLDWYGGYFDWETDGKRNWYSDITTIAAAVEPAAPGHPVLRGATRFDMREEFYHDIRFRDQDPRWTPIWKVDDLPSTKVNGRVVSWAVERADGGRGFATTCGHFYDNWKHANFRKTMLNALAWTAHVPIPENGVEAAFFSRAAIAEHLGEPDLIQPAGESVEDEAYADAPYWYKPGHPVSPAESAAIETLAGFKAERILTVPEEFGSWTALAVDPQGRLITAAQHRSGLYRVTVPPIGERDAETKVERLRGAAENMGWSHGLLYAFDSLYVTVSEDNDETAAGVYRLKDTDGDGQFDESRRIVRLRAAGEHGPHNMVVGPDGKSLYLICGNGAPLPRGIQRSNPVSTDGIDHLMPPGFESSRYTPAGWVCRFNPDGSDLRLVCSGLRNSFDLAFNRQGDLFTFDSDMEWDLGAPWYRPTRICHLVSGGEFGWRGDAAKWPEYYEDSVPAVVNIGPASPTGIAFGYGTKFPAKYQRALYACDWTFATIHAIHVRPQGAGYRAEVEQFVGGNGLPVTDLVIGADGAMYFIVGGRKLGSAMYRIHYSGSKLAGASESEPESDSHFSQLHALRRRLESYHGQQNPRAIEAAWPYLGHQDRLIRFAARVAVEKQPVDQWRERALGETAADVKVGALLALSRQGSPAVQSSVISSLNELDIHGLPVEKQLRILRVYELALARGEDIVRDDYHAVRDTLRPILPHPHSQVNRELSRLLCFVGDASVIEPVLGLMDADIGERPALGSGYFVRNRKYGEAVRDMLQSAPLLERMHHAQMLLWLDDGWAPEQRTTFFRLIADARDHSKGGYWYGEFWERIRETALKQTPESLRDQLKAVSARPAAQIYGEGLPKPKGPGRNWTLGEALEAVENDFKNRDFENGWKMFSAATCVLCHRFNGEGGSSGPDLSSLGQRFTLRDILDATLNPNKAISDQYRMTMLVTTEGRTYSGRIVSRDAHQVRLATDLMRPSQSITVDTELIDILEPVPVSTMPTRLLNALNKDELLDLLAYLIAGGSKDHLIFEH